MKTVKLDIQYRILSNGIVCVFENVFFKFMEGTEVDNIHLQLILPL